MSQDTATLMKAKLKRMAKYIYWIVGLIFVFASCHFLYNKMNRPVAGVLVFIGGILALYFYYVKWFLLPNLHPAWPPYQTLCPDYLSPVSPGGADGITCLDFVGVSRNKRIKKADPALISDQLNNDEYTFKIDPKESQEALKQRVNAYGLSWVSLFGE
jgi:hypothetical protein